MERPQKAVFFPKTFYAQINKSLSEGPKSTRLLKGSEASTLNFSTHNQQLESSGCGSCPVIFLIGEQRDVGLEGDFCTGGFSLVAVVFLDHRT